MNALLTDLGEWCRQQPTEEKWILVPGMGIGNQWLDAVARNGTITLNAQPMTLSALATRLAADDLTRQNVLPISETGSLLLIARVWQQTRDHLRYLGVLEPGMALFHTILTTLNDLRLHDVLIDGAPDDAFETSDKAHDLRLLAHAYAEALCDGHLVDTADLLAMATMALQATPILVNPNIHIAYPEAMERSPRENSLLALLPPGQVHVLADDMPGIISPCEVRFFRAVGETNEVREVLRRCLAAGIPLDQVELLYTDRSYVPLIAEVLERYQPDAPPATFASGLPAADTRPGRALRAWLEWVSTGCPQAVLVRMLHDGLLALPPSTDDYHVPPAALARALRGIAIGAGSDRYLPAIDRALVALETEAPVYAEDDTPDDEALARHARRKQRLIMLRDVVNALVIHLQAALVKDGLVPATRAFLDQCVRTAGPREGAARLALLSALDEAQIGLGDTGLDTFAVSSWLLELIQEVHVGAENPQPGKLHVAPLQSGGHTGRSNTFVLGLDDGRFPGQAHQDPLLLDGERIHLSDALPTSSTQHQRILQAFDLLLARLRGNLTCSYPCRDPLEDRSLFPSSVLLNLYRQLTNNMSADLEAFLDAVPVVGAMAESDNACLSSDDWWLRTTVTRWPLAQTTICHHFPHLMDGTMASVQRQSSAATAYDGLVPMAGLATDPRTMGAKPISPSRLEAYGKCPMRFFFQHVLGIEQPEEMGIDPNVWLPVMDMGNLLHQLFDRFLQPAIEQGRSLDAMQDWKRLMELLDDLTAQYRRDIPPPTEAAFQRQVRELRETTRIFFTDELAHQGEAQPVYLEAAIGMSARFGEHATPLDSPDPVPLILPNGQTIFVRGRIDRIDQVIGAPVPTFRLWDYKTGSTYAYHDQGDLRMPFKQGRILQHFLYLIMAETRLQAVHGPAAVIESVGYRFPSGKGQGDRVAFTPAELRADGETILGHLCASLSDGVFLPTDSEDDCRYCDYSEVCGQPCALSSAMINDMTNVTLTSLHALRR